METVESTVQTANQPQMDEATSSSFLGIEKLPSHADQNPEPAALENAVEAEEPVLETGEDTTVEAAEGEQPEEAEQPAFQDDWFNKLTSEEHAYYAKRYPSLYNAYQDANQPADLRQAFKDRVNQDRAWEERNRAAGQQEPTLEAEQETETQTQDPAQQRQQWTAQIESFVNEVVDPQAVNDLGRGLLEALGVDVNSKEPEIKAIVDNAPKLGKILTNGAVDLLATVLPRLLPNSLEQLYPGTQANYEQQRAASMWEEVRNSNPNYSKLPAYGKRDGDFGQMIQKVVAENPELQEFNGSPRAFYKMVAKFAMQGQQPVSPAVVETAIKTGQRQAAEQANKLAAGKVLGAGRSNRTLEQSKDVSPLRRGYETFKSRDENIFS